MEVSEKIQDYSFEELKLIICQDAQSKDMLSQRYAVRFIMLDNFDTYRDLKLYLKDELNIPLLELENLPLEQYGEKDMWISIDDLRNAFKQITMTTLVTPFSELARFYPDNIFSGFFNEISLLEDTQHPDKRIYVPLIGLQNRIITFLNHFSRIDESAPIWRCNTGKQEVHVYLSKYKGFKIPTDSTQHVLANFYDWLRFWKTTAPQEKIVCTAEPVVVNYESSRPDNIFTFSQIDSAYDFITQFLDIHLPIVRNEDEEHFWDELLKNIDKQNPASFSFNAFVIRRFNKLHFDSNELLKEWGTENNTEFDRWLLKNYALTSDTIHNNYLLGCLRDIDIHSPHYLFEEIAQKLMLSVDAKNDNAQKEERRQLMANNAILFSKWVSGSVQQWLQTEIIQSVQKGSIDWAVSQCTDTFDFEKRLYVAWYCLHNKSGEFTFSNLKQHYPEMAAYLMGLAPYSCQSGQEWIINYFNIYRQAKIKDDFTPEIEEQINLFNANDDTFYHWYHSLQNAHDRLAGENVDKIYWIDGLGAEFYPLIHYFIETAQTNFQIETSCFTRANLPSSTEHNRFDSEKVIKYGALDELAHSSHKYKQYLTLIDEIATLKDIINEILKDNQSSPGRIAIVSDHGLSCLSRKVDSKKLTKQAEHEGRFYELDDDSLKNDSDFIVHQNETDGKKYCVALRHASLGNRPTHEVHGGCCPEEIIVPFVIISNSGNRANYKIKESANRIPLSNPELEFSIIPQPQKAQVEIDGQRYSLQLNKDNRWYVLLPNATEGSKHIRVIPYHGKAYETEIEIYGMSFGNIDNLFN